MLYLKYVQEYALAWFDVYAFKIPSALVKCRLKTERWK